MRELFTVIVFVSYLYGVPGYVKVITPNGGENWRVGSTQTVKWEAHSPSQSHGGCEKSKFPGPAVHLYYNTTGDHQKQYFIAMLNSSARSYDWTIPNTPSGTCKLYVLIDFPNTDWGEDWSDGNFTIYTGSVTVKKPNGGENWQGGTFEDITWDATGNIPYVRLEYSINYGMNWTLIADKIDTNLKKLSWSIPNVNSNYCYVRISDDIDQYFKDSSDNIFSIYSTGFSSNGTASIPGKALLLCIPQPLLNQSHPYPTLPCFHLLPLRNSSQIPL